MSWRRVRKVLQRTLFLPSQANRDLDDEIRFHLAEEARLQSERGLADEDAAVAARRAVREHRAGKRGNARGLGLDASRAAPAGSPLRMPHPDQVAGREPDRSDPDRARDRRQHDGVLDRPQRARQTLARRARPQARHRELGGRERRHRDARRDQVYTHFLEHSTAFQPIAAFDFARLTLALDSGSYAVRAGIVSPNYFDTLGVRLVKGRSFLADEAKSGLGPRRRSRASHLAEHLRWRRRHRRTAGHRERRAGDGRRRCRGGFSWRALRRAGRSLGAARLEKFATGCN